MYELFDCCLYPTLTQSVFARKQGRLQCLPENGAALLHWGMSTWIGGAFTQANGEAAMAILSAFDAPRYVNVPDEQWRAFVQSRFAGRLKEKVLRLYRFGSADAPCAAVESPCIVPVTRSLLESPLLHAERITDELYSYTDLHDFEQNGFGLALIQNGEVVGYCLSEYSIHQSHGINIWIDERYRRRGYARQMVLAFLQHCRKTGHTAFWACDADNLPSNRTALSCGFVLEGDAAYLELNPR